MSVSKPRKFKKYLDYSRKATSLVKAYQGDFPAQLQVAADVKEAIMPRRKKQQPAGQPVRRRRYRRPYNRYNGYLRPVKFPVRTVIPWVRTKGTTGKWSFAIKLQEIIKNYIATYDEFKVLRLNVRWLPNNSSNSQGLTSAVLMDQDGFGEFGKATAAAWFSTICAMPGSHVGNRHTPFVLRWKPTEPPAREWRSYQRGETTYTICHMYMADNGTEDSELGGVILITGLAQGRGLYYNANSVSLAHSLNTLRMQSENIADGSEMV